MRLSERNGVFEDFFEHRSYLIMQYSQGDLNKKEFIKRNFDYLVLRNMTPYIKVDSYEKGIMSSIWDVLKFWGAEIFTTPSSTRIFTFFIFLSNYDFCILYCIIAYI